MSCSVKISESHARKGRHLACSANEGLPVHAAGPSCRPQNVHTEFHAAHVVDGGPVLFGGSESPGMSTWVVARHSAEVQHTV